MLCMGFIEDVEIIMVQILEGYQIVLFFVIMLEVICCIICCFMKELQEVCIQFSVIICFDISQSYWIVWGMCKNEVLVCFLEVEDFDVVIIFVCIKNVILEVVEVFECNGYNSVVLNGDMNQVLREQILECFKDGCLDILIVIDVVVRGLDVECISLVVNYDIFMDFEFYVYCIGCIGCVGCVGCVLLFVENCECCLLCNIECIMKLIILEVELLNVELLGKCCLEKFVVKVQQQLESSDLD